MTYIQKKKKKKLSQILKQTENKKLQYKTYGKVCILSLKSPGSPSICGSPKTSTIN